VVDFIFTAHTLREAKAHSYGVKTPHGFPTAGRSRIFLRAREHAPRREAYSGDTCGRKPQGQTPAARGWSAGRCSRWCQRW